MPRATTQQTKALELLRGLGYTPSHSDTLAELLAYAQHPSMPDWLPTATQAAWVIKRLAGAPMGERTIHGGARVGRRRLTKAAQ